MTTFSALEAKTHFGKLLKRVARGEEVVITKHEKPVARLVPEGGPNLKSVGKAAGDLRHLRERIRIRSTGKAKLTVAQIKAAVHEGRR